MLANKKSDICTTTKLKTLPISVVTLFSILPFFHLQAIGEWLSLFLVKQPDLCSKRPMLA